MSKLTSRANRSLKHPVYKCAYIYPIGRKRVILPTTNVDKVRFHGINELFTRIVWTWCAVYTRCCHRLFSDV